jgi:hypothetical protein
MPTFAIEMRELVVDGAPVPRPWTAAEIGARLGPADRVLDGPLDLHTYDALGVVVVVRDDGTVKELQFQFGALGEHDYTPTALMAGPFLVEGVAIDGGKAKRVVKALPGWGWESARLNADGRTWRGDNGTVHIYLNEVGKTVGSVAIGLD